MSENFGPVYEVTHNVDPEIIPDFDTWLGEHVDEMLQLEGISGAKIFAIDNDDQGRPGRVTQYEFDSDVDLEQYLAGSANTMRQSAIDRFAGHFDVSRRILRETEIVDGALKPVELCLNCGTALGGQYCGNCGQRAVSRLISIWELLREAFGDLLEFDSRLWRTLIPLAIRPGKLTREYLEGRRVRFMPPFRTYLVLSILFFLIAFFNPREELGILFEPGANAPANNVDEPGGESELRYEVRQELENEGIIVTVPDDARSTSDPTSEDGEGSSEFSVSLGDGDDSDNCDFDDFDRNELPPWLRQRLTKERLTAICDRVIADDGRAFGNKLLDNVPAALIALLPLMALVLKILYPLSKRFYVEHVLFVVHVHAFVFLILTLQILFSRLLSILGIAEAVSAVTSFAVSLYIPIYLFRAMRHVYGQGWLATLFKYLGLLISYLVGLIAILAFTGLIAALSI